MKALVAPDPFKDSLLAKKLAESSKRIIIGIGGSTTNDGGVGMGMSMALIVSILHSNSSSIGFGGGEISKLAKIDMSCSG